VLTYLNDDAESFGHLLRVKYKTRGVCTLDRKRLLLPRSNLAPIILKIGPQVCFAIATQFIYTKYHGSRFTFVEIELEKPQILESEAL